MAEAVIRRDVQGGALDAMMTSPSLALAELEFSLEGDPGGFRAPSIPSRLR